MKIFYPLEVFYPSQAGGTANTNYWISKNLVKNGFEPIFVATNKGLQHEIPLNQWVASDSGKVIYVKTYHLHFPFYQTIISLQNFRRADIIHISSFFFPTGFITALAARLLKKKLVWSAHGELDTAALAHSKYKKKPILWLIKKLIGKYPLYHSTCPEETKYIKAVFGDDARIVYIPNYIEIPAQVSRNPQKYLLYIGRIHPKKAIDNLIRATSMSKEFLQSEYTLKIAGKGKKEFEDDLKNLVKELDLEKKIEFIGQVEGGYKQKLLADAYFTIMPSHTENFGLVVPESLAQTTPVIASKGAPWKSLEVNKVGFWIENTSLELARKIDEILQMPVDEYEAYRSRSRSFVEREFDIEKNIGKWINLYKNM